MIKHQVELVNVVSKHCPLHHSLPADDIAEMGDMKSTIAQPPQSHEATAKEEITCLCDAEEANLTEVSTY